MALLTIEEVSKSYVNHLALDRVSLQVAQGECVALLGPSGCGKSTLLNIVAGFLQPDTGKISFDGQPMSHVPPHRRSMGMVFQDYALFPHLNVLENLEFGLRMRKVPARERRAPAMAALEMVGLSGTESRDVRQLSGGQQQRVAVARALVNEPKLLLFDEPLSNLDARLRDTMRSEIRALLERTKISAIFVTHDQAEAFAIADRIALLHKGRLVQIGRAEEIYEHPSSRFVASFLGGCNLISGTIFDAQRDVLLIDTPIGNLLAANSSSGWQRSARVALAVRLQHIMLAPASDSGEGNLGDLNRIVCRLESIEYLGAVSRLVARHSSGQILTAEMAGRPRLNVGQEVMACWSREHTWPILDDENP